MTVNPLIIGCDELTLTLLLAPNILLTPKSILQKICKDIAWSEYIKGQVMPEKVQINLDASMNCKFRNFLTNPIELIYIQIKIFS